ncbi:cilia- and flagella-associated protein 97 [Exaiptasia diaphana]|uniref:Uncharacterized protein n=1 Tax=Exaiptasia diaphana TaxID=2652724 RepID=A0A913XYH1_EXADI|nr:cilia- and flagella-associated protein 97 [Exaiptasia diaphana]
MATQKEERKYDEQKSIDGLKREHFLKPDSDQIDLNLLLKAVLDISEKLDRDKEQASSKGLENGTTRSSSEKTVEFDQTSIASSTKSRPKSSRRYDGVHRATPIERKNMSFSNSKVLDIDRENQRLLKKISSTSRKRPKSTSSATSRSLAEPMRVQTAAEVNRARFQRRVDDENQKILSRLKSVKPTKSLSKDYLSKEAASQKRFCVNSSKMRPSRSASSSRSTSSSRMSHAFSESSLASDKDSIASSRVSRVSSSSSRYSRRKYDFPKAVWEPGW